MFSPGGSLGASALTRRALSQVQNLRVGPSGNLSHWRTARQNVIAGSGRARIEWGPSDSKGMGAGAGGFDGATHTVGAAPFAKSKLLGDLLAAAGVKTNHQSAVGWQGLSTEAVLKAYDVRLGGLVSWSTGDRSIGGAMQQSPSPNVDVYSFAPDAGVNVDTVEIWGERGAARGTLDVLDGAVAATPTSIAFNNASAGFIKGTFTLNGRGTGKTINLKRDIAVAQAIHIGLVLAYDSTVPAVDIINAGFFGSTTADWSANASAWSPLNAIVATAPQLCVYCLGTNDLHTSVARATTLSNVSTSVAFLKAAGIDVIVANPAAGSAPVWGTAQAQADLRTDLISVAMANDCPFVDENAILGGGFDAHPEFYSDNPHENATGDQLLANFYAGLLLAA